MVNFEDLAIARTTRLFEFFGMEQNEINNKHFPHTIGAVLTARLNSIKIAPMGENFSFYTYYYDAAYRYLTK
jgi:hypothetical protein